MNNTSCGRARHKMSLMRYGNPEGGGARLESLNAEWSNHVGYVG